MNFKSITLVIYIQVIAFNFTRKVLLYCDILILVGVHVTFLHEHAFENAYDNDCMPLCCNQ
jgi:hypothetical protein